MNLNKLAPWNWFKHEDREHHNASAVPVHRSTLSRWGNEQSNLSTSDPLFNIHRQIDRLFEDAWNAFGQFSAATAPWSSSSFENGRLRKLPSIDIAADDHRYEVTLDVPGMKPSDIDIQVHDGVLTIQGQTQDNHETKEKHYYRMERSIGNFQRSLSLPQDAIEDDIHASIKDGVLKLEIPRREIPEEKVKRISISS